MGRIGGQKWFQGHRENGGKRSSLHTSVPISYAAFHRLHTDGRPRSINLKVEKGTRLPRAWTGGGVGLGVGVETDEEQVSRKLRAGNDVESAEDRLGGQAAAVAVKGGQQPANTSSVMHRYGEKVAGGDPVATRDVGQNASSDVDHRGDAEAVAVEKDDGVLVSLAYEVLRSHQSILVAQRRPLSDFTSEGLGRFLCTCVAARATSSRMVMTTKVTIRELITSRRTPV